MTLMITMMVMMVMRVIKLTTAVDDDQDANDGDWCVCQIRSRDDWANIYSERAFEWIESGCHGFEMRSIVSVFADIDFNAFVVRITVRCGWRRIGYV
jgi:hypothetical protein